MWEATCYLRVLGIETAAEASLSTVMKARRFGRFHSQHSTSPHPHRSASTACVCLLLASSFIHLPTVPPWPLLPSLREEWHAIQQIAYAWQAERSPVLYAATAWRRVSDSYFRWWSELPSSTYIVGHVFKEGHSYPLSQSKISKNKIKLLCYISSVLFYSSITSGVDPVLFSYLSFMCLSWYLCNVANECRP